MAGRPRTMLKRISELTARADAFGSDLYDLTPSQYVERPHPGDPLTVAWNEALRNAGFTFNAMTRLRNLLAEKVARLEEVAADRP